MTASRVVPLNTEGFSLIEVMIATVLLVTVLLGLSEFTQIGANSNMSVQLNTDFANLSSSILYVLSSPRLCTEALGNGISAAQAQPFDPPLTVPSPLTMQVGGTVGTLTTIASVGPLPGSISGMTVTKLQFNQIYGQYVAGAGTTNYIANLYLEVQKKMANGKPYLGAPILSRNFLVNVNVDTVHNVVLGCN